MNYSCGYWTKDTKTLADAQIAKMNLIGQKLKLKPGMRVLDIGIGFGGIDKYLAETFGVSVVGYTVSKDMAAVAQRMCEGLQVEVRLADFREISGTYDAAFSIEMIEHVGLKNLRPYFEIVNKCLVKDGIFLLHLNMVDGPAEIPSYNPFLDKYLFYSCYAPRLEDIVGVTRGLFIIEDLHNLGISHYHTFKAWDNNFVKHWPKIQKLSKSGEYDDKFYRFFRGYLLGSAATHFARIVQLEQFVFTKTGLEGGYVSVR
jgi:cyclopropane-fatty-acyl-phospholipid synthase